ncbi:MAG: phage Gp37/Gp68 family protein [Deltaproteobacteria bacterium]|jgi:protein gp37|nr:phage Gp37/Gp68 family protein [Deltaproteobacteria bacterium]
MSKIEWTGRTWNPVTGCSKISAGCLHCYAETLAARLQAMGLAKYARGFQPSCHEAALAEPSAWKKPQTVFVCSMADLFHETVPFSFIDRVLDIVRLTGQHRYQILTKRAARMAGYFAGRDIPENVWLGVTAESPLEAGRIEFLRNLPASVRFLSCEPLLGNLGRIDLTGIDWVIAGGESGVQARPMDPQWVRSLYRQAEEQGAAFFFKQWGAWGSDGVRRSKKDNGKTLDGRIIQMMPEPAARLCQEAG